MPTIYSEGYSAIWEMWVESNFPVDKISYSYNVVYNAFKRLSKGYSPSERAAMFHDTAVRVYSIDY